MYALNGGSLPAGFFALTEQITDGPIPDVVTLQRRSRPADPQRAGAGIALADTPPQVRFVTSAEVDCYAAKANRIVIKHPLGQIVAVIEILSPGNKDSRHALRAFVNKAVELLRQRISLLVVDLFPPSPRDPQGIHRAIWDEFQDAAFELPVGKPLTVAAYAVAESLTAYVEPVAVADRLPSLPIFLEPGLYVPAPLEATYQSTWDKCPEPLKEAVETRPQPACPAR